MWGDGPSWLVSGFVSFSRHCHRLGIAPESAVALIVLAIAVATFIICMPIIFCCTRPTSKAQPTSPHYTRRDVICKKGLFALMLARLDEFDTLTPLLVTPPGTSTNTSSESEEDSQVASGLPRPCSDSDSPPPPRRPHQGRTLIVPLGRYRSPAVPLLGTPDSRVVSMECGTTKSCATIPEDDEGDACDTIDDLVSIDRTSVSASEHKSLRYYFSPSGYNLMIPQQPPEFQSSSSGFSARIPVPTYSAPDVPRPHNLYKDGRAVHKSDSNSSSIGSVHSSLGTGSPLDTTGSISDSFYINSDVISSTNGSQIVEAAESDVQSKFHLHRIEEESEAVDDSVVFGRRASDRELIPRSISQQFELMRRT